MDRARKAEPRSNKLLYDAELRHRADIHERKMRATKPAVDVSAPKSFGMARRNLKREQMLEDRYSKIEHENRMLLGRMSEIMTRPQGGGAAPGAGGVDNVSKAWQYGHSLNTGNRRREMARITEDNQQILRRIRGVTPVYNHMAWEESAAVADKLALQLSEFKALPIGADKRRAASPRGGAAGGGSVGAGVSSSPSKLLGGGSLISDRLGGGSVLDAGGAGGSKDLYGGVGGGSYGGLGGGSSILTAPWQPGTSLLGGMRGASAGGAGSSVLPTPAGGAGAAFYSGGGFTTPGGSQLGQLGPQAAALLAQYGYGSVPLGGAGVPAGGAAPSLFGAAGAGQYPRIATGGGAGAGGGTPLNSGMLSGGSFDASKYLTQLSVGSLPGGGAPLPLPPRPQAS